MGNYGDRLRLVFSCRGKCNTKMLLLIMLTIMTTVTQAIAEPVFTAVCEEPSGSRIDYMTESIGSSRLKLERSEDRVTGVNPTFIIDSDRPKVLTYVWGPTKRHGDLPAPIKKTTHATIVVQTKEVIIAVEVWGSRGVAVSTLLPKMGFGAFTHHAYSTILGDWFEAVTLTAKCKFETN